MPSGYSLTSDSPPIIIEFPKGERFESSGNERSLSGLTSKQRTRLKHETEELAYWVYPQGTRRTWRLVYRLSEPELEVFMDLDEAVNGDESAFYFYPDVDNGSPPTSYLVRKEADFDPRPVGTPKNENGTIVQMYDYTLELKEESVAGQILA